MEEHEEYFLHVKNLRIYLRDHEVSLQTLYQGVGLPIETISDCLFLRRKQSEQSEQVIKKIEIFLENNYFMLEEEPME